MANIRSAKKRIRQTNRQTEVNRDRRSRVRSCLKKIDAAIKGGDGATAREALRHAQPELARGVARGVFHRNMAARRLSRLSARIKALNS